MNTFILPNKSDVYTVYGAPGCPYCTKACELLRKKEIEHKYYNVEEYGTRKEFFEQFKRLGKIPETTKTIPVIYTYGIYIGGYTDLENRLNIELVEDF